MKFFDKLGMTALIVALAGCASNVAQPAAPSAALGSVVSAQATVAPKDFGALAWRVVGPAVMGGRLDSIAGVAGDPTIVYLGHSSGGLYKSEDGGMTFTSTFDKGRSASIGAVAVAPSDPKTVYVGTGEGFPRNTAALGDGVYVSNDAGKTWGDAGLKDSQHIARIAVSPTNPKIALVAAMGHEFTPGGDRGIFRTADGGKTWRRALYVNDTTGGSDVAFDPNNASVAFAGTFEYLRHPWGFLGGGAGSGLWKSTDGGVSWKRLTDASLHNGLPSGILNRVGFAISAHHSNTIYALIPWKNGMLYRSDDGGAQWKMVSADHDLVFRPFYFSQIKVDPDDVKDVWVISGGLKRSHDGGKTFKDVSAGGDNHDLWIDPQNHKRLFLGSDVGFHFSLDGGKHWSFDNVMPFSQIYRVGYDHALPYHIMGGMQDHETWWGPNTIWNGAGVDGGAWRNIASWGDGQYAKPDPKNDDIIYENTHFGDLARIDLRTGELRNIAPVPAITFGQGAESNRYRFNWSAPLLVSTVAPGNVYFGGNVLFRTTDGGQTWGVVSPDLTQPCDTSYLVPSGGPITHDNTNAETYCTIYALAQTWSGALWAGTDNGHLHVSSDGGGSWHDVIGNVKGLPPQAMVDSIEAGKDGIFATFDRHRLGDTKPYLYVTRDDGATWKNISANLPLWAYVIRQDPRAPKLLFAGTEDGIWTSFDGGDHWSDLRLGTAHVPVYDLQIQPDANDLIAGTHGRGFAILDDLGALENLANATQTQASLLDASEAYRYVARPSRDYGQNEFLSDNKPYGSVISYYLKPKPAPKDKKKKAPKEKIELQILDGDKVIRNIEATTVDGVNRVVWDLTTDAPGGLKAKQDARPYYVFYSLAITGPEVLPGTYTVRLKARGQTLSVPVTVKLDPALRASQADLRAQYDALAKLAALQERGETWISTLLDDAKKLKKNPKVVKELNAAADRLRNGNGTQNAGYQFPARVVDQIAYLRSLLATSYTGPTQAESDLMDAYAKQLDDIGRDVEPLIKRTAPLLPKTKASPSPAPRSSPRGRPD